MATINQIYDEAMLNEFTQESFDVDVLLNKSLLLEREIEALDFYINNYDAIYEHYLEEGYYFSEEYFEEGKGQRNSRQRIANDIADGRKKAADDRRLALQMAQGREASKRGVKEYNPVHRKNLTGPKTMNSRARTGEAAKKWLDKLNMYENMFKELNKRDARATEYLVLFDKMEDDQALGELIGMKREMAAEERQAKERAVRMMRRVEQKAKAARESRKEERDARAATMYDNARTAAENKRDNQKRDMAMAGAMRQVANEKVAKAREDKKFKEEQLHGISLDTRKWYQKVWDWICEKVSNLCSWLKGACEDTAKDWEEIKRSLKVIPSVAWANLTSELKDLNQKFTGLKNAGLDLLNKGKTKAIAIGESILKFKLINKDGNKIGPINIEDCANLLGALENKDAGSINWSSVEAQVTSACEKASNNFIVNIESMKSDKSSLNRLDKIAKTLKKKKMWRDSKISASTQKDAKKTLTTIQKVIAKTIKAYGNVMDYRKQAAKIAKKYIKKPEKMEKKLNNKTTRKAGANVTSTAQDSMEDVEFAARG